MIKQKRNQKVTEQNKKRVNVFKLQERVTNLEKQLSIQLRINANQVGFNDMRLTNEASIDTRIRKLELKSVVKNDGILKRMLNRFWDFLGK